MKREELIDYDYDPDFPFQSRGRFYIAEDVDRLLDEMDTEIAELKKKLNPCLNGDCILTCDVVEKYGKENAELKAEIESLKASHDAEMVDAGMRERRLRRALYKAISLWARERSLYYYSSIPNRRRCGLWESVEHKCLKKANEYR